MEEWGTGRSPVKGLTYGSNFRNMEGKEVGEMKTSKAAEAKKVIFSLKAPEASQVYVAGSFNGWDTTSHPMKKSKTGVWKISIPLAPGTYEYLFFVEGQWRGDPESSECVANPFGTTNCVRRVA
jgi:1,4-alpha-glucan branching enzyme